MIQDITDKSDQVLFSLSEKQEKGIKESYGESSCLEDDEDSRVTRKS